MKLGKFLFLIAMLSCCFFSAIAGAEPLQVGFAGKDITPATGVPLGGYGGSGRRLGFPNLFHFGSYNTFFHASEGVRDPIRAKVLLLKEGDQRLLFVSLDIVGLVPEMYEDLIQKLGAMGFGPQEIFISATHTHSGPGAIAHSIFWGLTIMDLFNDEVYNAFSKGILDAVSDAVANLTPAELYATTFVAQDLQVNRRNKPGHFDPNANVLFARSSTGAYLGAMINLPVHGTALSGHNYYFSADVPGSFERSLETKFNDMNMKAGLSITSTVLFVNGAEGDVAPKNGGDNGIVEEGDSFATQATAALANARKISPQWTVHFSEALLGEPALHIKECLPNYSKYIFEGLHLDLNFHLPERQPIAAIHLGDMVLMTWPGEPTTTVGFLLKDMAAAQVGSAQSWVMGLTNGYVAYFTTPQEFAEETYESCSSLYGAQGADRVLNAMQSLLSGL